MARRHCRICGELPPLRLAQVEFCTDRGFDAWSLRVCWQCLEVFRAMLQQAETVRRPIPRDQLPLSGFVS